MSEDWVEVRLGDVAQAHKTTVNPMKLGSSIVDHYSLPAFDNGKKPERVPAETIKSNKLNVPSDSILVSRLNPHIPRIWTPRVDPDKPSMCSTEFAVLSPTACEPAFLRYFVESDEIYGRLGESVNGTSSSHQRVSLNHLLNMRAPMPPPDEQRWIAEVLGTLDDAIEVSRSLIESLEASIILEAAAVLESAGEETQLLTDVATIVNGYSYKSSELVEDSDTAIVNLKNFGRRGGFRLDGLKPFDGTPKPAQMLVFGDAMVAKTDLTQDAEVIGRCLRMPALPQFESYVASLDIAIVRSKGQLPQLALCALLTQAEFRDHCLGFVNGTTVLHMSKAALESYTLPVLDAGQVAALTTRVEALAGQQDRTLVELYHLQQMRDFLLPRLLSGELRVAAAEEIVGAAT
jgi:type I restriction enzyme S subunit